MLERLLTGSTFWPQIADVPSDYTLVCNRIKRLAESDEDHTADKDPAPQKKKRKSMPQRTPLRLQIPRPRNPAVQTRAVADPEQ